MMDKRQIIPAAGLLATVVAAVYMVVQLNGQTAQPTADLTNAALAEVRNAQGQAILSGQFQLVEQFEQPPDADAVTVVAPSIVAVRLRLALLRRVMAEARAESEPLDVGRD